jgi:hypothetical protein
LAATLERLRFRLGAASARFQDDALREFLDTATSDYGLVAGADDAIITLLALALCYQSLAAGAAANFKYSQGDESVDKTAEAAQWRALFESTWASLPESIRELGAPEPDTFILGRLRHHRDE